MHGKLKVRTQASGWRWSALLLVFVILALAASVAIPARATERMIRLFHDLNEIIEPARLVATRLQAGLAKEEAELEVVVAANDALARRVHAGLMAANSRYLDTLEALAPKISPLAVAHTGVIRTTMLQWRRLSHARIAGVHLAESDAQRAAREKTASLLQAAITDLQMQLSAENRRRRAEVQEAGRLSFISNAELVLAALIAIVVILVLLSRERRLMEGLRDHAARETSLRTAAESLAAAYTREDIAERIAQSSISVLPAHSAFVTRIADRADGTHEIEVCSGCGSAAPPVGTSYPLQGSGAETAILAGLPSVVKLRQADTEFHAAVAARQRAIALVVPLHNTESATGALYVLSDTGFDSEDMKWARTLQHLTTLAYEKVRHLDIANDRRDQLENVMKGRSRLMRGFSHDVKNPLGAADGYAALLEDGVYGELTPEQRRSVTRIRRSVGVALSLIDDLHDFARAEAGRVMLDVQVVDVSDLLRGMEAQYAASAYREALEFKVDIAPHLPLVRTDSARLRQIVSNLLSNAFKYTAAGSVRMRAAESIGPTLGGERGIRIEVSDTGPGIPEAKQSWIFDEFSRIDATTRPGAGLGLSISKLLAEALGGAIGVDSTVGDGSTFSLWIPLNADQNPLEGRSHRDTEARLDAALDMTFPASDPVAL